VERKRVLDEHFLNCGGLFFIVHASIYSNLQRICHTFLKTKKLLDFQVFDYQTEPYFTLAIPNFSLTKANDIFVKI
jgi:hypothetical protein